MLYAGYVDSYTFLYCCPITKFESGGQGGYLKNSMSVRCEPCMTIIPRSSPRSGRKAADASTAAGATAVANQR
jgi:hypothetical protein